MHKILIVIPALNEEGSIKKVVEQVFMEIPNATCLVIDDGSSDKTSEKAKAVGSTVITLPYNLGVGGAMRVGFNFALLNHYDVVVQVDADGQHKPSEVKKLIEKLDKYDIVIGARFAGKGEYSVSLTRSIAMKFLAFVISRITRTKLTDTTSGFRASGKKAIKFFAQNYPTEYLGDTVESTVIASKAGLKITQVPVEMLQRETGRPSQDTFRSIIFLFRVLLAITIASIRPKIKLSD